MTPRRGRVMGFYDMMTGMGGWGMWAASTWA